jgi:pilus assembly protein Flp/PilA
MFEFSKSAAGGLLGRFLRDESGTSAIEYAIIASGVSIVIVGTVATLGTAVNRDSPDDSGAEVNILRFSDLPAR